MAKTYININGDIRDAASLTKPQSREFRNAWQFNGNVVEVDMTKAVELKKDTLRRERAEQFSALDAEYMQALETGDDRRKGSVAKRKQQLRDMTKHPKLIGAKSPEELISLTLDDLV